MEKYGVNGNNWKSLIYGIIGRNWKIARANFQNMVISARQFTTFYQHKKLNNGVRTEVPTPTGIMQKSR